MPTLPGAAGLTPGCLLAAGASTRAPSARSKYDRAGGRSKSLCCDPPAVAQQAARSFLSGRGSLLLREQAGLPGSNVLKRPCDRSMD